MEDRQSLVVRTLHIFRKCGKKKKKEGRRSYLGEKHSDVDQRKP